VAENVLTIELKDPGPVEKSTKTSSPVGSFTPQTKTTAEESPLSRVSREIRDTLRERIDKTDAAKVIDSKEIDFTKNSFAEMVKKRVADAIADGAKVVMHTDGGRKTVELDAEMRDKATGNRWGAMSLLFDKTGKEFIEIIRLAKKEMETPARSKIGGSDIELDASKLRGRPIGFDPNESSQIRAANQQQKIDDFELDASKGSKFNLEDLPSTGQSTRNLKSPVVDALDIELDASKAARMVADAIDQEKPRWLISYEEITAKLAKNLLTVQEAHQRIDRLVASRKEDVTDYLREKGMIRVGDDPAKKLKQDAVDSVKDSMPQVEKKSRPVAMPKSYESDLAEREKKSAEYRKDLDEQEKEQAKKKAEADSATRERNEKFGRQVSAVDTGLRAGLQGGATAKVGAGVQVAASGLLGGQAAAIAAGPVGIAAIGAASAVDTFADAARRAKQFLDDYAERGERIRGFNADIAAASAVAQVAKLQADIREANKYGKDFAAAIDAKTKSEIAFREAIQPLEQIASKIMVQVVNKLIPLIEYAGDLAEDSNNYLELISRIFKFMADTGLLGPIGQILQREPKPKSDQAPPNLLGDFFKLLDSNIQAPAAQPQPPAVPFGPMLGRNP
jgi:hypothetical protein